jgi:Putative transposase
MAIRLRIPASTGCRREEGAYPQRSVTDEQRSQRAVSAKTLRAAGLLPVACVGLAVTAHCGDAPPSPPWPPPKSLAAGPLWVVGRALNYLGAYVARTALSDSRMVSVDDHTVRFRWKNRAAGNRREICTLLGVEFVARYLRHVLPRGLRSIRYYGFCHPAARANRMRVQCHAGGTVQWGDSTPLAVSPAPVPLCSCCRRPMRPLNLIAPTHRQRGPPTAAASIPSLPTLL